MLLVSAPAFAQNPIPVAVTGFTADVVANGTGTAGATTTTSFDDPYTSNANSALMEKGFVGANATATVGLPTGGLLGASATSSGVTYQLASYSANNSLRGAGKLTLTTPRAASKVYVLAGSGQGSSTMTITINFTDNTTQAFSSVTVPDWFYSTGFAYSGIGRVFRNNSSIDNNTSNPRLFDFVYTLSAANANKAIQSISVSGVSGGVLNVLAVSIVPVQAAITSISPSPAGTGIPAALTGTGLGGATSLIINGSPATILTNTGTTITFRVPAGASTTGPSSVVTPSNTATSTAFTYLTPPGNALAFDGVNDFVSFGATPAVTNLGPGNFTLEAWVYYDGGTGAESIIRKTGDYNLYITGNTLHAEVWPSGTGNASWLKADGTTTLPANRWTHVAAVWNKTATTYQLYVNGVADGTGATTASSVSGSENLTLGKSTIYGNLLTGRLDEVRIYTAALTAANIQADMTSPTASVPTSLGLYLNFDEGTGSGANSAVTTLFDTKSSSNGTLTNFTLASGNTTSNWVESYALVVPGPTAATSVTTTSFVANWIAPSLGSVDNGYRVELAIDPTFATLLPNAPVGLTGTSYTFTNLTPGTTYYYRVRADKKSTPNQGANSSVIKVALPPSNVATLSNLTLSAGALSPAFASGTTRYTITVPGTTISTTVTPTVTQASATVTVDGMAVASGTASNGSMLNVGDNTITVTVTAQDGTTQQTYTVVVTRTCALTVIAQNVATGLDSRGTATVIAEQVDNGSSSTCAPIIFSVQRVLTARVAEGTSLTLTAPAGTVFTAVTFASYGTPVANGDGTYSPNPNCHASTSQQVAESALLGKNTATIQASSATFGDPCTGAAKTLVIQATYTPAAQLNYTCADLGTSLVALTANDSGGNTKTVVALVTISPPSFTSTTWNGSATTDWTDCRNWDAGLIPSASVSAVIPADVANYPNLPAGTYPVKNLTIASGARLTTAAGAELQVNGDFSNNGTTSLTGPVTFVGTAATQTIGGSNFTPFSILTVNKPSGTVQLGQSTPILVGLTMSSGLLDTKAYQLKLKNNATISETAASYVIGQVATARQLAPGTTESFGGLGLSLTPAAGSTAPGFTPVVRTTGTALSGTGTSQSVLRYFDIQPSTNTGLNVTMIFTYFSHELNGIPAANLRLFKSTTTISGPWTNMGASSAGTNSVTRTGLTDFSIWTLGNSANPLPVSLVAFTAQAQGPDGLLKWTTASELRNDYFAVESSADGVAFQTLGKVAGHGTSVQAHDYQLLDRNLARYGVGTIYYRLRQVDLDGTTTYSPVRTLAVAQPAGLALYPNPTRAAATLTGAAPGARVLVYDALSRLILCTTADAAGTADLALPTGLATGVYLVRAGSVALRLSVTQ